ncbi:tetratricopeptide repeat protein [Amycolatopsis sp. NPDC003731]
MGLRLQPDRPVRTLRLAAMASRRLGQIDALNTLGYVSQSLGQHAEAREHFLQAINLCRKADHSYAEATNLIYLGDAYAALGQPDEARKIWQAAVDLLRSQARTAESAQVDTRLAQEPPRANADR